MLRPIIEIDESKCNGCGQCILNCAEGALAIVNGKAKLINEVYCDGLGACLNCPQGALHIVEREAQQFNAETALAAKRLKAKGGGTAEPEYVVGCLGSAVKILTPLTTNFQRKRSDLQAVLSTWPLQLRLVPPSAPFLKKARVLLAAHCAGFALPNLHEDWLIGRVPIITCPKLEDKSVLMDKLTNILRQGNIEALDVLRMSVPCCSMDSLTKQAIANAKSNLVASYHVVQLQ